MTASGALRDAARSPARPFAWIVALAVGVAIGVAVAPWVTPRAASGAEAAPSAAAHAAPDFAALQRAIERLPQELREQLSVVVPTDVARAPIGGPSGDVERLALAIERLNELLASRSIESQASEARAHAAWAAAQGEGYPSLAVLEDTLLDARANDVDDRFGSALEEACRKHRFWTREDVVARYGAPAAVQVMESSLLLAYAVPQNTREDCLLRFGVTHDLVAWVNIECGPKR